MRRRSRKVPRRASSARTRNARSPARQTTPPPFAARRRRRRHTPAAALPRLPEKLKWSSFWNISSANPPPTEGSLRQWQKKPSCSLFRFFTTMLSFKQ